MRKVILDLNVIDPKSFDYSNPDADPKKELHRYIAEQLGFDAERCVNTDRLYDELISVDEPTAIGLFMPNGELEELDIDYMMYLDTIKDTFNEAEADNPELAVIHGDINDNGGVDDGEDVDAILEELLKVY